MTGVKVRRAILKDLLDNGELVNITVQTEDGGEFKVHAEVLVASSPYFKHIITRDKKPQLEKIYVEGISKEIVSNIINYMYTGKISIDIDEVQHLNDAALKLQIINIVKLCKKFLADSLDETNCIRVYNFAKSYRYDDLQQEAKSYIMLNFVKIFTMSKEYLLLPADDLRSIINADELNVPSEDLVFCAIMKWIEHDPDNRRAFLADFLRCIRFGLCNFQFLQDIISTHPFVIHSEDCQSVLYQASVIHMEISNAPNRSYLDLSHPFVRPRLPSEIIFIVGGWSAGSATNVMETYDLKANRWFLSLSANNMPRAYHGMISIAGKIYIIGGFDGNQCFNSVRRFDPVTHAWEEMACMYVPRCYVSVAALDGRIYALGGYDGQRRSSGGERYDPNANQWTLIANMLNVRSDASADSLDGKVYIAGGFNGAQVLNTAETYDPENNSWTLISNMSTPRSGVKLVTYEDALYVIGGFNGTNRLSTVEKYDRKARQWISVPSMRGPRSNFATVVMEGCLYAIGGFNGLSTVSSVECFDSRKNFWSPVADLNLNRSALAACVVKGLPNAQDYSFLGALAAYR